MVLRVSVGTRTEIWTLKNGTCGYNFNITRFSDFFVINFFSLHLPSTAYPSGFICTVLRYHSFAEYPRLECGDCETFFIFTACTWIDYKITAEFDCTHQRRADYIDCLISIVGSAWAFIKYTQMQRTRHCRIQFRTTNIQSTYT